MDTDRAFDAWFRRTNVRPHDAKQRELALQWWRRNHATLPPASPIQYSGPVGTVRRMRAAPSQRRTASAPDTAYARRAWTLELGRIDRKLPAITEHINAVLARRAVARM